MTKGRQPVTQALGSDRPEIDSLLDDAFGPDRQERTTYRLRDSNVRMEGLSRVVRQNDGHLCGSIEFWPVEIVDQVTGQASKAVLLGPVAVSESCRGQGVGSTLMRAGVQAARTAGHRTIILVGDLAYYGRFGFSNTQTQNWSLPGPIEQHRLLVLTDQTILPDSARIRALFSLEDPHGSSDAHAQ
jgi:predicted N-acetyltransferase YhbS